MPRVVATAISVPPGWEAMALARPLPQRDSSANPLALARLIGSGCAGRTVPRKAAGVGGGVRVGIDEGDESTAAVVGKRVVGNEIPVGAAGAEGFDWHEVKQLNKSAKIRTTKRGIFLQIGLHRISTKYSTWRNASRTFSF